jgi:DNA adenine methylase
VEYAKGALSLRVINDLDSDPVSFYRVLQNHLEEFLRQFKWLLTSREWFEDWKRQIKAGGLTDIQRAARHNYLQRNSFAGKVRGRTFGTSSERLPGINLLRSMEEELSAVHLRLARVTIENLAWDDFLGRYDRPATFFYPDPPYWKKPVYEHNLKWDDFVQMAAALEGLKGKSILSINDTPETRKLFGAFTVEPVNLNYTAAREGSTPAAELLVRNF